jgi:DNA-directed RNA polymerase specialized sigma24 family protein
VSHRTENLLAQDAKRRSGVADARLASKYRDARRRSDVADARLANKYRSLKRWLIGIIHQRYGLSEEDCEEIANDTLLAWHRALRTGQAIRDDRAFCATVARSRTIDRLRHKTVQTVHLSVIENIRIDSQVDALVAEREELGDLQEVAREVLKPHEYAIVRLVELGVRRAIVANQLGLSLRQVKRVRERVRQKLDLARAQLKQQGRCQMVSLTIAEIDAGAIGPADPRSVAAVTHLARCAGCRRSFSVATGRRPSFGDAPQVTRMQTLSRHTVGRRM